jgi:8-oxo-dGTP pyrophosphatase MutT (NUDIX family)
LVLKHKVFAYITSGRRLLVFDHPHHPEAGTQVPAGTRPKNEAPERAVLREAKEETGLSGLRLVRFLGEVDHPVPALAQVHHRRFYHLLCTGSPPERWQHDECDPSDGSPAPILFELYWVDMPDAIPELAPGHGALLGALMDEMGL